MLVDESISSNYYVDHHVLVTVLQVSQHGGFIQEGQVGHVLGLVELGRIHLLGFILLHGDLQ